MVGQISVLVRQGAISHGQARAALFTVTGQGPGSARYQMIPSDPLPGYQGDPRDMASALGHLCAVHGGGRRDSGRTLRLHSGSYATASSQHVHSTVSGSGYARGGLAGGGSYAISSGGGGGSYAGGGNGGSGVGGSAGLPQFLPHGLGGSAGANAPYAGLTPGIAGFSDAALAVPDPAGEIPDSFEPVRGYRWWAWKPAPTDQDPAVYARQWDPGLLSGMKDRWSPGENIAKCLAGNAHSASEIPLLPCGCGFWAYWQIQHYDINSAAYPICGVVEGYGAVIIGEKGFRAAKARIIALAVPFTLMPVSAARRVKGSPWDRAGFTGKVHYYGMDEHYAGPSPASLADAAEAEHRDQADADAWMGIISDRLAVTYPGAEVFATVGALMAKYPPDKSYGPAEQPCPHCGTPAADLYDHMAQECARVPR